MELREKKQKRCAVAERAEAGDIWDHTAIAADSKLIVSLVVGKRTQEQTRALVHDAHKRLRPGHLPAIFTDAYEGLSRRASKPLAVAILPHPRRPRAVPAVGPALASRLGLWEGQKIL